MHSPHSPLHPHLTTAQSHNQNKLSARYINNTKFAPKMQSSSFELQNALASKQTTQHSSTNNRSCKCTTKDNSIDNNAKAIKIDATSHAKSNNDDKIIVANAKVTKSLGDDRLPSLASKMICSCENPDTTNVDTLSILKSDKTMVLSPRDDRKRITSSPKSTNAGNTKRVVATRNAATSPNLNVRKLSKVANPTLVSTNQYQKLQLKPENNNDNSATNKIALEKSNSLGDSKPLKQLRNTRSLSPRPPIRHQQAIIVSDENEIVSVKLTSHYETNKLNKDIDDNLFTIGVAHGRKGKKNCRSEQTSPNVSDLTDKKFVYNQVNNRSTSCLVYVPTDPWLKLKDLENASQDSFIRSKSKKSSAFLVNDIVDSKFKNVECDDPWVKRAEPRKPSKSPKHDHFRQVKSFSDAKFDLSGSGVSGSGNSSFLRPRLLRCKSPLFSDELPTSSSTSINNNLPLQSAPSSPHFLNMPENPFSSAFSLAHPYTAGNRRSNSPSRSASFSPARARTDSNNPFVDMSELNNSLSLSSHPPSISVAAALVNEQQFRNDGSTLDVCNPNLLQARHSFCSVSNAQHGEDELQLNIRRLSEQMRKPHTNHALAAAGKISMSDRNVNTDGHNPPSSSNSHHSESISAAIAGARGADFSDYLKQFRCVEAKKAKASSATVAGVQGRTSDGCASHSVSSNMSPSVVHKAAVDSLLETSC